MGDQIQKKIDVNILTKNNKKMKSVNSLTKKKGQISLFMVIGVIILIMFILIFYLVSSITESRVEREVRRTTSSVLTSNTMQYYVSDCLKDILKEGLITLGKQGGYFYENQSGYEFKNRELPRIGYEDANISYLIFPKGGFYNVWWPCSSSSKFKPSYCRFSTEAFDSDTRYGVGFSKRTLPRLATEKFSIKSQLETYIATEVQQCVNLSELESHFPGYNLTSGKIDMDIIFGVFSVNVELSYPIKMRFQDYEPILEFYRFKAEVPIRFAKIYDLVDTFLDKETFFLNSIPEDEAISLLQYSPEIKFTKKEQGFNDVFIINDSFSMIDGKEYVFQFARKNRPPVLNYISRSPSYLYDESDSSKDIYDYLAVPVSGLKEVYVAANATDADEDRVIYFSQSNTISMNQAADNIFNYTVSETDIGYHNITIIATDGEIQDLDRQKMRLLVDRILEPKTNLINFYGGAVYSKEDPFFLNATSTNETLDPFATYTFVWYDDVSTAGIIGGFILRTNSSCTVLPTGEDCSNYEFNIENMTDYEYLMLGTGTLNLNTNLIYTELSQMNDKIFSIERKDCVPYRNPNSAAYPYNITDAFFSDHTCCSGEMNNSNTWQLAGTNVICHEEYTCTGVTGPKKKTRQRHCSGNRGNICDGNWTFGAISDICGCGDSATACNNVKANDFANGVWCYGDLEGCGTACTIGIFSEAVDTDNNGIADDCGCLGNVGAPCDGDFNGDFEGNCGGLTDGYQCI